MSSPGQSEADGPPKQRRAPNTDTVSTAALRSVSACKRCRGRKNRCDQQLPACSGCVKAGERCVGFDPGSKRAIPRSYIYYLETRVRSLEARLRDAGLSYPPPEDDFAISDEIKPGVNVPFALQEDGEECGVEAPGTAHDDHAGSRGGSQKDEQEPPKQVKEEPHESEQHTLDVRLSAVPGASGRPLRDATLGVSFARLVRDAVERSTPRSGRRENGGTSRTRLKQRPWDTAARDSFFGLVSRSTIEPAPFPSKAQAKRLTDLYFEHANPQIPVLHRGEFEGLLERVYAAGPDDRSPRELYFLNIVFAVGSGIIMEPAGSDHDAREADTEEAANKRRKLDSPEHLHRYQPEQYHASAMPYLERFTSSPPIDQSTMSGLEEIQAILLLAGVALLRPVAPGLWYIVGVAMRLAVDLNLHSQDTKVQVDNANAYGQPGYRRSLGRKQWTRDMRRRLWWCVYAFDRLLSTFVNRPFGIADDVITTAFPTLLDDRHISVDGFLRGPDELDLPSYKLVAQHYLRLRLLQSEIIQVLQHQHATEVHKLRGSSSSLTCPELISPFLQRFGSFRDWRNDVHDRLGQWNSSAPQQTETGVAFSPLFLELNFWQAIIMLYMPSIAIPQPLTREMSPSTARVDGQNGSNVDARQSGPTPSAALEDEQVVSLIMAQAGHRVLKIYFQLHRRKLVNYTFLATHHLFTGCIAFLSAIWHSQLVRSQLTLDDVNTTVNIATSVLGGLSHKCPPAEAYRKAYVRMSNLTIAMVQNTTGFGTISTLSSQPVHGSPTVQSTSATTSNTPGAPFFVMPLGDAARANSSMAVQKLDVGFKDLFSEAEIAAYSAQPQPQQQFHFYHLDRERMRTSSSGSHPMEYHQDRSEDALMMPGLRAASTSVVGAVAMSENKVAPATQRNIDPGMTDSYRAMTPSNEDNLYANFYQQANGAHQTNTNGVKPSMGYDVDWLSQSDPTRGFDLASVGSEDTGLGAGQVMNPGFDFGSWFEGGALDQFIFGDSGAGGGGGGTWEADM